MPRRPKIGPLPNAPPRPIVVPEWAHGVQAAHSDFDEVLELASFEFTAVFTEPYTAIFRDLASAARAEWSRLGETADDALLVAYQLVRLAPGILECLEEPEYAWLLRPAAAIGSREDEFERRVHRKAGAPRQNDHLRAVYGQLRAWGLTSEQAVTEIAAVDRFKGMMTGRGFDDPAQAEVTRRRARESVTHSDIERVKRAIEPSRAHYSKKR